MAKFHVVCLDDGKPYKYRGAVMVYNDGATAQAIARNLSENTGTKWQPRPIRETGTNWRGRELDRFCDGVYTKLPWAGEEWFKDRDRLLGHFAHASTDKSGMMAFTASDAHGQADRQTRIKPGPYLTKFYAEQIAQYYGQPIKQIQELARQYSGLYEGHVLRFAKSPDDIESVYLNGPTSCMSHKVDHYHSEIHPARVYGAGDLAVAYLGSLDCAVARALCWPRKKVHGRIYGDIARLEAALQQAGYKSNPNGLAGAKLERIPHKTKYFVLPYLDNALQARDMGEYLCLALPNDDAAKILGQQQRGISGEGSQCVGCHEQFLQGDLNSDGDCEDCAANEESNDWRCANCGDGHSENVDAYEVLWPINRAENPVCYHAQSWCENCLENDSFRCDGDGRNYATRARSVEMANGETWSERYFLDHGFTCADTGENRPNEEAIERDGVLLSPDAAEARIEQAARDSHIEQGQPVTETLGDILAIGLQGRPLLDALPVDWFRHTMGVPLRIDHASVRYNLVERPRVTANAYLNATRGE